MAQSEQAVWNDFAEIYDYITGRRGGLTIDKLKRIIDGINSECHSRPIAKHGKKQDLIDRLTSEMNDWRARHSTESYALAKEVIIQVRDTGKYEPKRGPAAAIPGLVYTPVLAPAPSNYALKGSQSAIAPTGGAYPYNGLPRPGQASTASSSTPSKPAIRFSSSPFLRVDQAVSNIAECAESISAMDRRSQIVSFTLGSDHVQKLSLKPPNQQPCPVEFPPTCEVRVNGNLISANLKGLKKKAGTAPPADLGTSVRVGIGLQNKVEMIYVNGQQPVQHKKFYLVIQLVETFSIESVVDKIKRGKYKTKDEIMASIISTVGDDDDIVAGPQKMSLKCPLSYVRISIPVRSIKCVHPQCFDANSWFSMMEQTTTWLCPVCEKTLNVEDLIVDGYFDSILQSTDEDVEDVMVEADGEWHTTDNKYSSSGWQVKRGSGSGLSSPPRAAKAATPTPALPALVKRQSVENIVIIDSDDDDDLASQSHITTRRQAASSRASSSIGVRSSAAPYPSTSSSVIDLTNDSDDDLPAYVSPPPPPAPVPVPPSVPASVSAGKRKEREQSPPGINLGKRPRFELPPMASGSPPQANGSPPYAHLGGATGTAARPSGTGSSSTPLFGRLPIPSIPSSAQQYDYNAYPSVPLFPGFNSQPGPSAAPPAPATSIPGLSFALPLPPSQPPRRSSGSGTTRQGW